uniref:Uncharacterized protein n=1 Tax=Glossina palpalis gambiensis TaxID=67801 RepID=A0A1B0C7B1_9MUSC
MFGRAPKLGGGMKKLQRVTTLRAVESHCDIAKMLFLTLIKNWPKEILWTVRLNGYIIMPHHRKQQQQIQSNQQQKQLEKLHQLQQEAPKRSYSHDRENWSQNSGNLLDPPYHELECNQFEKAKLKLENYFSKPLPRADRVNGEIQELRNELISCHRDHPGELLCCAEMAAKFQELIFREQFVSILKFSHNTDENQQRLQQEKGKEPKHFTRID